MPKWFKKMAKGAYERNPDGSFMMYSFVIEFSVMMLCVLIRNPVIFAIGLRISAVILALSVIFWLLHCYGAYLLDKECDDEKNDETVLVEKAFTRNRDHYPEAYK